MRDVSRYHRLVSAARRRLAGAISTMALLIAVVWVAPAWAIESIVLDQDRILYGEEGSTVQLAEIAVETDRVGASCTLRVHTENQYSVHPGNDLVVTTGGTQSVIEDVEAEPDADADLSAAIVLGPELLVELRFGPDQVSSMGFDLSVDCPDVAGVVVTQPPACPDPSSTTTPSTSGSTPTTADGATDACQDPTPVSEVPIPVPIPTPTVPQPCATGATGGTGGQGQAVDGGNLTLGQDGCGSTTTAPPTTPPTTVTTTTPPTPPTTAAVQATTTTTVVPVPTVQGIQIFRLPQTPAAAPVQANPAYTG